MMTLKQAEEALAKLINDEEYKKLSTEAKQQKIFDIAKELSTDTAGSKTVLFSGRLYGRTIKTGDDIAEKIANNISDVRIINKTDVGQFLGSIEFNNAIYATIDNYDAYKAGNLSPEDVKIVESKVNLIRAQLVDPTDGPWAEASKRFVASAKGEVILIIGDGRAGREASVFSHTEFPELVKNSDITKIKNIEKDKFLNLTSIKSATI